MNPITVSTLVGAPLATVWAAFTEPAQIVCWNFASDDWSCPAARNDLRVGGRFASQMAAKDGSASFEFGGEYTAVVPMQHFEYVIADGRRVRVEFEPVSGAQTRVTETFEAENTHSGEQQRAGWGAILENFRKHAESVVA